MKIIQKDQSVLGTDKYRDDTVDVPNMFKPTIDITTSQNQDGTVNTARFVSASPVTRLVDGHYVADATMRMTTNVYCLQNVSNDVERNKMIDDHIAMLEAHRGTLLFGELPDEPVVLS